jgi:hypothetical protein
LLVVGVVTVAVVVEFVAVTVVVFVVVFVECVVVVLVTDFPDVSANALGVVAVTWGWEELMGTAMTIVAVSVCVELKLVEGVSVVSYAIWRFGGQVRSEWQHYL